MPSNIFGQLVESPNHCYTNPNKEAFKLFANGVVLFSAAALLAATEW